MIKNLRNYIQQKRLLKADQEALTIASSQMAAYKAKGAVFVHIPKTAGISLVDALYGEGVTHRGHRSVQHYQKLYASTWSSLFSFTFVRNPWDRLYSAYCFLAQGGLNDHDKKAFDLHLSKYANFEQVVLEWLNEENIMHVLHFWPQHVFLVDSNGQIGVDFVGRFENIKEDFAFIAHKLGVEEELPHHNQSVQKLDYRSVYTDEMVQKVAQVYATDVHLFNYSFER
jgi:hypothetical protein